MTPSPYTEDTLVQQTTADYLEQQLGWESVYAHNHEDFGPDSLLGRTSEREVVLTRPLRERLAALKPEAYDDAVRRITATVASQTIVAANREKYDLLRDGVQVTYRDAKGRPIRRRLRVLDFDDPDNNHFLCVREMWVRGDLYRRRPDIVGFVNGLPLLFIECKNIHRDLQAAFEKNYADYRDTVPHLFHHNAVVMFGNGEKARIGSITSRWGHFHEWKRLAEDEPGAVDMETLLKGVCNKSNFLDLVENFILFDDSSGETRKILARNHQFLGVNRAVQAVCERRERVGKLGVFWHTQGAGKSYSMVLFTRKVRRRLGGNFTFLVLTDRDDLDTQIYKTFAGCGVVDHDRDPCRASSGEHLGRLLAEHKAYVFSLIQKFNQDVESETGYTQRDDVIVISDEAHRTQYGTLALNMRNALPNAGYIGFTGTPLFTGDEITRQVFGDYVSTYDFQRAVEDGATVPLCYDARGDDSGRGDRRPERTHRRQAGRDRDRRHRRRAAPGAGAQARLPRDHRREAARPGGPRFRAPLLGGVGDRQGDAGLHRQVDVRAAARADRALLGGAHRGAGGGAREGAGRAGSHLPAAADRLDARDPRRGRGERGAGRGGEVPPLGSGHHPAPAHHQGRHGPACGDAREGAVPEPAADGGGRRIQGAGAPVPHRGRLRHVADRLRRAEPLDPLPGQAAQGAHADAGYRPRQPRQRGQEQRPDRRLLRRPQAPAQGVGDVRRHAIRRRCRRRQRDQPGGTERGVARRPCRSDCHGAELLHDGGAPLDDVIRKEGFARNAAIVGCKEVANESDETRKRFEVLCREVFKKFKACINNVPGVNAHRADRDAIDVVYRSLQQDREQADIRDIIRVLHEVVDAAIDVRADRAGEDRPTYDISPIDFDRLKREFERSRSQRSAVQALKHTVEERLRRLLARNPLRTDFQQHYEAIVADYNREKDRVTIERTFEELLKFFEQLEEEENRALREGLDEESLAVFDLLKKPDLGKDDIRRIKTVSKELLRTLKAEKLRVDQWREKEATQSAVKVVIHDFLYSDQTGLPAGAYSDDEVEATSEAVFAHVYRAYPTVPSPLYDDVTAA